MAKAEVVCIMGPTASGKTDLAMQLYDDRPCDLISVDSALVYRHMDIGTAKPSQTELLNYPHQLINICNPDEPYSASKFRTDALGCIENALSNNRLAVLVGGTMLYFKALLDGMADLPSADQSIRDEINSQAEASGWPALHNQLAVFDPISAERIKPNDSQRLQRAIEVYRISGKTLTQFYHEQKESRLPYRVLNLAIAPTDRTILRERIRTRFMQMLADGLLDEVSQLIVEKHYDPDLPALRSVGYRQVIEHLQGQCDYQEMIENAVVATARLAKRQVTWLRGWPDVNWLESSDPSNISKLVTLL